MSSKAEIYTENYNSDCEFFTDVLIKNGVGREAIQMYEKAFEGKIICLITYREANDPAYMPLLSEEQKDYVYHAELVLGKHSVRLIESR